MFKWFKTDVDKIMSAFHNTIHELHNHATDLEEMVMHHKAKAAAANFEATRARSIAIKLEGIVQ